MALLPSLIPLSNGTVAKATDVQSNFETIRNDYNGNITNANIASGAAIEDTKLKQITTGGKVSGLAITALTSLTLAAGIIPTYNIPLIDLTTGIANTLGTGYGGTGTTANANAASGVVVLDSSSKLPAVDGSKLTNIVIGINGQAFTSSGTWTRPAGVTKVLVKVIGGGGEGYNSGSPGNGGTSSFAGDTTIQATGGAADTGAGGVGSGGYISCSGEVGGSVGGNAGGFFKQTTYGT